MGGGLGASRYATNKIMKTYYSDRYKDFDSHSRGLLLFLPDLQRELNQYISKDISELEQPFFSHLATSYQFAHNSFYNNGLQIWRDIIKSYYELITLNLQLNKHQEMYELYAETTIFLAEGQQELFYSEQQLENNKSADIEILLKLHSDKYHTLYESCLRYSITLFIWCLDNISAHKDMNSDFEKLLNDDISYKIGKIDKCKSFQFINPLSIIKEGVEPLIRNSVAHKTFEYLENKKIKFIDRDNFKEYNLYELKTIVDKIHINYLAQLTALTLFSFDNIANVNFSKIKRFRTVKQLRIIIDQEFRRLSFIPKNIDFQNESIVCVVEAPIGYDSPTEFMGNIGGKKFNTSFPPVNIRNTILSIIYYIADLKTNYNACLVTVYEFASEKQIGFVKVNLAEWTRLYDSKPSSEELDKYIIKSTLPS